MGKLKFIDLRYLYGGEIWRLGDIIIDLQNKAPNRQCVDRYLQGLLRNQKPVKLGSEENYEKTYRKAN